MTAILRRTQGAVVVLDTPLCTASVTGIWRVCLTNAKSVWVRATLSVGAALSVTLASGICQPRKCGHVWRSLMQTAIEATKSTNASHTLLRSSPTSRIMCAALQSCFWSVLDGCALY